MGGCQSHLDMIHGSKEIRKKLWHASPCRLYASPDPYSSGQTILASRLLEIHLLENRQYVRLSRHRRETSKHEGGEVTLYP